MLLYQILHVTIYNYIKYYMLPYKSISTCIDGYIYFIFYILVYCSNKYNIYVTIYIYLCSSFFCLVTCIFTFSLPGLFVLSQESDPPPRLVQSKGDASRGPLLLFWQFKYKKVTVGDLAALSSSFGGHIVNIGSGNQYTMASFIIHYNSYTEYPLYWVEFLKYSNF